MRWCSERDLNSHASRHRFLRPACLPIPPSEQAIMVARDRFELSTRGFSILCSTPELSGHFFIAK